MGPKHVCLFDIDGTLISSGGAGKSALVAALASEFGIEQVHDVVDFRGRTDRAIVTELLHCHNLGSCADAERRLREGYLRHLPEHLKQSAGCVLPGVAELLATLRRRSDVAVGLLTGNIREGARIKLGHFGLFDHFTFGGFGDRHLDRDDVAREALAEVRARFNGTVAAERIWVIGDTPLDIRCARAIGARAVAVVTGWHEREELEIHEPDLLLSDLREVHPLLRCWDNHG